MAFVLCEDIIDGLTLTTIKFIAEEEENHLSARVPGYIANACDSNKERLKQWKRTVAKCTKDERENQWDDNQEYAISLGFSFCLAKHRCKTLDVENYIKPVLDAIAAGLFCKSTDDPETMKRFAYNDSHFLHFFVTRFAYVKKDVKGEVIV